MNSGEQAGRAPMKRTFRQRVRRWRTPLICPRTRWGVSGQRAKRQNRPIRVRGALSAVVTLAEASGKNATRFRRFATRSGGRRDSEAGQFCPAGRFGVVSALSTLTEHKRPAARRASQPAFELSGAAHGATGLSAQFPGNGGRTLAGGRCRAHYSSAPVGGAGHGPTDGEMRVLCWGLGGRWEGGMP